MGEVGGVLGGHRGAACRGRWAHARGVAVAGAHARPGDRGITRRPARGHHQLDQPRRVGRRARPGRRRHARCAARVARTPGQPAVRRADSRSCSPAPAWWSSTKPTASATGGSTSVPTTNGSPVTCSPWHRARRCWPPPRPPTSASPSMSPDNWASTRSPIRGSLARTSLQLAVVGGSGFVAAMGVGRRCAARVRGLGHRVRTHGRRGRAAGRVPPVGGPPRRRLLRPARGRCRASPSRTSSVTTG